MIVLVVLLQLLWFSCINCKHNHPVPTYFGRLHPDGTVVDATNPANRLKFNFRPKPSAPDGVASLTVSPSSDIENGQMVKVAWSNVSAPTSTDVVILLCPPNAGPEHYLDFVHVNRSDTYTKGYGEFEVRLWNMRKECQFSYYRNDNYSVLVVRSPILLFKGGSDIPLQGHLALTGDPTEMRIMWVSGTDATSIVKYGTNPYDWITVTSNVSKTYTANDMCAPPANGPSFVDPGFIHDVLLRNLTPGSRYYYTYGSETSMSSLHNFVAAPVVGSAEPFTALVYGDMGLSPKPGAYETADYATREAETGSAALVIHDGDISYARGYAYIWEQWFALIEPYATIVPYMVAIGNHEQDHLSGGSKDPSGAPGEGFHPWWAPGYGTDSGGECGVPMFYRFHMPDNGNAVWWYSFDYGSIHFLIMSTENNFTAGSPQYEWMENDLKSVNRTLTPWVVIAGHRPMYSSQMVHDDYVISIGIQKAFEDLLIEYEVDLAFWAHYHSYERTCPMQKGQCTPGAPVHIVVGTAGKDLDTEDYYPVPWSLFHENDYGYGKLTLNSRTELQWQWVENKSGQVKDSVTLRKDVPSLSREVWA
ncbi:putative inactive purple acid phosphatase 2 [Acropora cervicornis]|uniref:Purple acid phosphatase n=1 Tax=Acropora cervicornis TaxID=6130 RepID=A0AAD9R452_ACRCE|nr:putative inactive purple acid phosphatase 2 [Acropora cervicornis]